MIGRKKLPERAALLALFSYDYATGVISSRKNGEISGWVKVDAARKSKIRIYIPNCGIFYAHRIAWKIIYGTEPPEHIDHVDGNALNNIKSNLRSASQADNSANAAMSIRNKTGAKGVFKYKNRWKAYIGYQNKSVYIGCFRTFEDASNARKQKAVELFGNFARHCD